MEHFSSNVNRAKLLSLNVKGRNSNIKRHILLTELKFSKADIGFIQETHFNKEGNFAFICRLYPIAYLASQIRNKAGVAILISQSCPIQVQEIIADPNCCYAILRVAYQGTPLLLCNVYVTNVPQISLLQNLLLKLS